LSTGRAVGGKAWQLSATDLRYASIAPSEGFVGSADLIAELRLSNGKIADRRAIHLEWMAPISPAPARPEPDWESIPQLQPERQDVQPQRIIDPPHVPLPQGVPQSTGAKGVTVESRAEPEITNSTCYASASAVRQDHPEAWPSWTLRALGHEGTKCWYPTTRTFGITSDGRGAQATESILETILKREHHACWYPVRHEQFMPRPPDGAVAALQRVDA
jgi:hypothetical protein